MYEVDCRNTDWYIPFFDKLSDLSGNGVISVRSENNMNGIVTLGPKRAIINVSMRLNNDSYRLDRGHGWKPQARLNWNSSLALNIKNTSTVDRLAIDPQMKLGLLDQ
eukprot:200408-Pleurochrysis_carterae.AAC.1